jgi:hypothetical protein
MGRVFLSICAHVVIFDNRSQGWRLTPALLPGGFNGWPHDAAGRNAAHVVRLLEFVGETVAIRAGRTAYDKTLLFARPAGGQVPRSVRRKLRRRGGPCGASGRSKSGRGYVTVFCRGTITEFARLWTLLPLRPSGADAAQGPPGVRPRARAISGIRLPKDTDASETPPFPQLPASAPNGRTGHLAPDQEGCTDRGASTVNPPSVTALNTD